MEPLVFSITKKVLRLCREEAKAAFPREAAGFLIGVEGFKRGIEVEEVWFPEDRREYVGAGWMEPPDHWFLEAEERAGEQELEVVGWFHSHPWRWREVKENGNLADARPSDGDFKLFTWNKVALICAVREGGGGGVRTRMKVYPPLRRVEMRVV